MRQKSNTITSQHRESHYYRYASPQQSSPYFPFFFFPNLLAQPLPAGPLESSSRESSAGGRAAGNLGLLGRNPEQQGEQAIMIQCIQQPVYTVHVICLAFISLPTLIHVFVEAPENDLFLLL
ncbi:hypothetical protein QBC42DRAFT_296949 [Cladorrhinum samala]|uniref:Uncharacterized protein n=1 Tax=Cladorrhinum samala TaxID=585594 RepID=A0AAV9HS52_9PEZI|nr:hypothetical protein QBC42DRAFT_296949 [Cladorrhinum samala]